MNETIIPTPATFPVAELLSHPVTYLPNGIRKWSSETMTLAVYFARVSRPSHSAWSTTIEIFRTKIATPAHMLRVLAKTEQERADPEKIKDRLKTELPAIKPSGAFAGLNAASLKRHSHVLCVDLDVKDNPRIETDAGRTELCERLRDDPHVFAYHVSSRGKGLAVFAAIDAADAKEHAGCFRAAEAHFRTVFDLKIDPLCRDVSRNRFVSFDPDCWWRTAGEVVPFEPSAEAHRCDNRSTDSCDTISEKESSSLPLSASEEEEQIKTAEQNANPGGMLVPADAESRAWPTASRDWPPAIERIYGRWLGGVTPHAGIRNSTMVERVPILLSVVGPDVVERFMLRYYQQHAGTFADYPLADFTRQTRSHIRACVESYATNPKVGLNEVERAAYVTCRGRESLQAVFRICRSMSRSRVNHGGPFPVTADHLSKRLACHSQVAARQLKYLVASKVLKVAESGERWQKGRAPRATKYCWLMGTTRRQPTATAQ